MISASATGRFNVNRSGGEAWIDDISPVFRPDVLSAFGFLLYKKTPEYYGGRETIC